MCKRVLLKNWKIQSLCFCVAVFYFLLTVHDFSRRTAKYGVFSVATKSDAKILLLLPCWEKMSPLKCLLTLTSPPSTLSGGTTMVVITTRINILTSVITVIATFSVCSISHGACHKQHTHKWEKCRQPAVTNPVSLWKQIQSRSHDKSGHVAGAAVLAELGASAQSERGRQRRRIHRWFVGHRHTHSYWEERHHR